MKLTRPLIYVSLLSPLATLDAAESSRSKPNILFILGDALGCMDVCCFNLKTIYETLNFDSLTKRGIQFTLGDAAFCVCSPTRGSIMTGKCPPRFDITNFIPDGHAGQFRPAPQINKKSNTN